MSKVKDDTDRAQKKVKTDKEPDEATILRKLNRHLLPPLILITLLNYIDRSNLAFAALQLNQRHVLTFMHFFTFMHIFKECHPPCTSTSLQRVQDQRHSHAQVCHAASALQRKSMGLDPAFSSLAMLSSRYAPTDTAGSGQPS